MTGYLLVFVDDDALFAVDALTKRSASGLLAFVQSQLLLFCWLPIELFD